MSYGRVIETDALQRTTHAKKIIMSRIACVLREEQAMATNIESAVDKASIGRDEVIAAFGSMHCLILEMVSDLSDELVRPLENHPMERPMRDVLIEFGNSLHILILFRT